MIIEFNAMEKIVQEDATIQPECGSGEASVESFIAWYGAVKNEDTGDGLRVSDFDVNSVIELFDRDLKEFSYSMNK